MSVKSKISLLLFAVLLTGQMSSLLFISKVSADSASEFNGHPAEEQLTKWVEEGYLHGSPDGQFNPDQAITRAEFITIANRICGLDIIYKSKDVPDHPKFRDVSSQSWYAKDIAIAVESKYISGYSDHTFRPNEQVTRAEAALMIARLLHLEFPSTSAEFKDSLPNWAKGEISAVINKGMMKGYPDGTFRAEQPITRAEVVVALDPLTKMLY